MVDRRAAGPRARAAALVAPAFGFVARFLADIGPEAAAAWARTGRLTYRNEWMTVPLRHDLVVDVAARSDARLAARYATDTLIVHGARDERVPWRVSGDFVAACPHRPLDLHLLGDGDHRLTTRLPDLAHLVATVARRRPPRDVTPPRARPRAGPPPRDAPTPQDSLGVLRSPMDVARPTTARASRSGGRSRAEREARQAEPGFRWRSRSCLSSTPAGARG